MPLIGNQHRHGFLSCFEFGVNGDNFTLKPIPTEAMSLPLNPKRIIPVLEKILTSFAESGYAYDPFNNIAGERTHRLARELRGNDPTHHTLFQHKALQKGLDLKLGLAV